MGIQSDNQQFQFKLNFDELQKLFSRVAQDVRGAAEWHDLSIEMITKNTSGLIRNESGAKNGK